MLLILRILLVMLFIFAFTAQSSRCADTLFVKQGAASGGDGKSWATAFETLQAALEAWMPGDELWVSRGTYTLDVAGPFFVRDSMRIYGGFKGTEVFREHRDWYRFPTILSADILGNDGQSDVTDVTDPRRADNLARIIVFDENGCDSSTMLDGLHIAGANSIPGNNHAILIQFGSPVFRNCQFEANATFLRGGAIQIEGNGRPRFEYCVFSRNTAQNGGGVHIVGQTDTASRGPIFAQCVWANNYAHGNGAAVELGENAHADFNSCIFYKNIGSGGGSAIAGRPGGWFQAYNSTFVLNEAGTDRGWMIEAYGASIVNCIFWHGAEQIGALIWRPTGSTDTSAILTLQSLVQNDPAYGFYTIDPDFIDVDNPSGADGLWNTDDDGLRVKSNSICRDKGLVTSYTNFTRVDAIGNPRVVENRPDIGAYEWQRAGHDDYVAHMAELRTGKLVQLYRHGITDWGLKDPGPGPECPASGRNLSEDGRDQTKSVGKHMKALDVPIEDSFTSPVCRCWESALYQAGRYDKKSHWASGGGAASDSLRHIDLSSIPVNGCRMINTHDAVIVPTIDASSAEIEEGDAAILRPNGANFTWISHFTSDNWERFRVRFPDASVGVEYDSPAQRDAQAPLHKLLYTAHSITVYNVLGTELLATTGDALQLRAAIDDLANGWYAIVVNDVDGTKRAATLVR